MDLFYLYLQSIIQIILETVILLGIFLLLIYLITIPTLLVLGMSTIFTFLYYFFVKKKLKKWGTNRQAIEENRIKFMQEGFNSLKEINFFKRHNFFLKRFHSKNIEFYKIYINFNFLNSLPRYIFELFTIILISLIFFFLLEKNFKNDEIIKILALFFVASFRTIPSIYRIFSSLQNLKYTYSSTKILYDDFNKIETNLNLSNKSKLSFKKNIELLVPNFLYKNESNFKIHDLRLEIKKNQKIGIIGKSGSGKSTLLDIFTGIIDSEEIKIKLDGKILTKDQIPNWQRLMGLIPQSIAIINDSFKQNIIFGLEEKYINEELLYNTIKISNLQNLVNRLPQGLLHNISEKGANLSGGEIQRIGIARALIVNPEILIFDEATSALDTFTENEILNEINSLPNKTIIMVSHRINSLKYCDKIYLVDNGTIIKEGLFSDFKESY